MSIEYIQNDFNSIVSYTILTYVIIDCLLRVYKVNTLSMELNPVKYYSVQFIASAPLIVGFLYFFSKISEIAFILACLVIVAAFLVSFTSGKGADDFIRENIALENKRKITTNQKNATTVKKQKEKWDISCLTTGIKNFFDGIYGETIFCVLSTIAAIHEILK